MTQPRLVTFAVLVLAAVARAQDKAPQIRVLEAGHYHLGDSVIDTWPAGPKIPQGLTLRVRFEAERNDKEYCLVIKHFHVDDRWPILLNGNSIGKLARGKVYAEHHYVIPKGRLSNGENELFFKADRATDDILIGGVKLVAQTQREFLRLRKVRITVRDRNGRKIPAKITITDAPGKELSEVYYSRGLQRAIRNGVVYTTEGDATIEIPEGEYRIYASRGVEWGVDERRIRVAATAANRLDLRISREIDTTGYVASDSHIHTLTFSGHGDLSVEERMVTLAGEGVELAIATDHNHNTDYRPYQEKMGLTEHFTPVVGNEVTTSNGHFNAFPLNPKDRVPEHRLKDWVKVVAGIRAKGAKVVILNHPRWPRVLTNSPFGREHFHLNRLSGQRARGPAFTFDAMELINATVKRNDPIYRFIDWFALLNHGDHVMAVGTSDSHTVGDPVGQGRTYVRSSTDDPAHIDVDEACASFKNGHSSVSQGLFVEAFVAGKYSMGQLAPVKGDKVSLSLRVASAGWAVPDRARIYVNGELVADQPIVAQLGRPTNQTLFFELKKPKNDAHVVCIATGPGVRGRFWRARATGDWVLGAANPIFLDVDRDGKYTSPRHRALQMLRQNGLEPKPLLAPLADVDDAVAVQVLGALHESYVRLAGASHERLLEARAIVKSVADAMPTRPLLSEYVKSIPMPARSKPRTSSNKAGK